MLPGEEEAHEIGGSDRLDFSAQAIERVAVDAREESAIAPFGSKRASRERTAEDGAFGFEFQEGGVGVLFFDAHRFGQLRCCCWAEERHSSADDFYDRVFALPLLHARWGR